MTSRLERAHALLERCALQFDMYARNHWAKNTLESDAKARANEELAQACWKEIS